MNFLTTLKKGDKVILSSHYRWFETIISKVTKTTITVQHRYQEHKFRIADNKRIGYLNESGHLLIQATPANIKKAKNPAPINYGDESENTILFNQ
jgi:hypothetical protein